MSQRSHKASTREIRMEGNSLTTRSVITVHNQNFVLILSGKYERLARKFTVLSFWRPSAGFAVFKMPIKMDG